MPRAMIILAAVIAFPAPGWLSDVSRFGARVSFQEPSSQSKSGLAKDAVQRTRSLVDDIIAISYPELRGADVRIETFRSQSDYFKARFGIPQFFFTRMRFL